jgi:hypothetical protein
VVPGDLSHLGGLERRRPRRSGFGSVPSCARLVGQVGVCDTRLVRDFTYTADSAPHQVVVHFKLSRAEEPGWPSDKQKKYPDI